MTTLNIIIPTVSLPGVLLLLGLLSLTVAASAQTAEEQCINRGKLWVNGQCTGSSAQKDMCERAGGTYVPMNPSRSISEWCLGLSNSSPSDNDTSDNDTSNSGSSQTTGSAVTYGSSARAVARPPNLIKTQSGNRSVQLIWGSDSLRRTFAQGFEYRVLPGPDQEWTDWQLNSSKRTASSTVDGLDNCVSHSFQVRSGPGGRTYSASAIPGLPMTPESPSTASGDGSVALHGMSVAGNGSPVSGYLYRQGPHGTARLASTDGRTWQATVSGLDNDATYTFSAQALNECGAGLRSVASAASPSAALPIAPKGLEAESGGRNGRSLTTLRWNQDLDGTVGISADGSVFSAGPALPGVTGYQYRARKFGSSIWLSRNRTSPGSWLPVAGGATATGVDIVGLIFGDRYEFQVRATGSDSQGAISTTTAVIRLPPRSSAGPLGFVAEWTHANQAELTWSSPHPIHVGQHQYRASHDYGVTWTEWENLVTQCEGICQAMVSLSAQDAHRYLFQLRRVRFSGISEAWTGTHPDAPQAPTLAEATKSDQGTFTLRWTAAEAGNSATAWEYRRVYLDGAKGSAWTEWMALQPTSTGESAFEYLLAPFETDTARGQYAIQVRGTNAHGPGADSNMVTVTH